MFPGYASLEWVCEKQQRLSGGPQAAFAIPSIKDFAEFSIRQERVATTIVTIMKCWLYASATCKDFPLCYLNKVPQYSCGRKQNRKFYNCSRKRRSTSRSEVKDVQRSKEDSITGNWRLSPRARHWRMDKTQK